MRQGSFFGDFLPVPEPMPLPARDCRAAGKQAIAPHIGDLHARVLGAYRLMGPLTDAELADYLGVERTTAIPRRTELMQLGKVQKVGSRKNENTGVSNTTYGLS